MRLGHYRRRKKTIEFVAVKKAKKSNKNTVFHEVHMLRKLGPHPNVVGLHQWFETTRHYWLIQELLGGGVLTDIISSDAPLPEASIRKFAVDVATGLYYIHSKGIAAVSVQPQDLLLGVRGNVKLSRFKNAVQCSMHAKCEDIDPNIPNVFPLHLSDNIASRRSLWYMAPEVIVRLHNHQTNDTVPIYTDVADMWAFGVLLYELAGGVLPATRDTFTSSPIMMSASLSRELLSLVNMLVTPHAASRPSWATVSSQPFWKGGLQLDIQRTNLRKSKKGAYDIMSSLKTQQPATVATVTDNTVIVKPRPISASKRPISATNRPISATAIAPASSVRSFVVKASDMSVKPVMTCRVDPPELKHVDTLSVHHTKLMPVAELLKYTSDEQQQIIGEYVDNRQFGHLHMLVQDTRLANVFISSPSFIKMLLMLDQCNDNMVGALAHIIGLTVRFSTSISVSVGRNSLLWNCLLKAALRTVTDHNGSSWNAVGALGELLFYAATQTTLDPTVRITGESASNSDYKESLSASPSLTPRANDLRPTSAAVTENHLSAVKQDEKSIWPFPADGFHGVMSIAMITILMHLDNAIKTVGAVKYGIRNEEITVVPADTIGYSSWGAMGDPDCMLNLDENQPLYLANRSALRTIENLIAAPTNSLLAFLLSPYPLPSHHMMYHKLTSMDPNHGIQLIGSLYGLINQSVAVVVRDDEAVLMPLMPLSMFTSVTCILMRAAVHAPKEVTETLIACGHSLGVHPLYPLLVYLQPSAKLASRALGHIASAIVLLLLQSATMGKSCPPPFLPCHPLSSFIMYILQAKRITVLLRSRAVLLLRAVLECEYASFVVTWLPLSKPLGSSYLSKALEPADIYSAMRGATAGTYDTHTPAQFEISVSCVKKGALSALALYRNALQDGSFPSLHASPNKDESCNEDELTFFSGCVSHVLSYYKSIIPAITNRLVAELTRLPTPVYPSLFPVPMALPQTGSSGSDAEMAIVTLCAFFGVLSSSSLSDGKCSEIARYCSRNCSMDFFDSEVDLQQNKQEFNFVKQSHKSMYKPAASKADTLLPDPIRRMRDVADAWQVVGLALAEEWLLPDLDDVMPHIVPHLSDSLPVCTWQGGWLVDGCCKEFNPLWGCLQRSLYRTIETLIKECEIVFGLIGDLVTQTTDLKAYKDTLVSWVLPTCLKFLSTAEGQSPLLGLKIVSLALDAMPQTLMVVLKYLRDSVITKAHYLGMVMESLYTGLAVSSKPNTARQQHNMEGLAEEGAASRPNTVNFPVLDGFFSAICNALCGMLTYIKTNRVSSFALPVLECLRNLLDMVRATDELLSRLSRPIVSSRPLRLFILGKEMRMKALDTAMTMVEEGEKWLSSNEVSRVNDIKATLIEFKDVLFYL